MQLPIDVKALIDEATNIKAAYSTDLSVSIYIDNAAPADLVAHVRSSYASSLPSMRLSLSYLDRSFSPRPGDDFAIIVAGSSHVVGAAAAALRAVGVPVMVATTLPATVARLSAEGSHPVPDGDVVAPCEGGEDVEPIELDDAMAALLDERMGQWIVSVCHDKRLAFSIAFPFMRRPLAKDAVSSTSLQNAGIGLAPFIPGADLPLMTLNQAKMVLQIAAAYGHEMNKDRAKELAAVVGGAYVCRTLARELSEFVPVLGVIARPGIAYGGTAAIGNAVIEYYEGGENAAGVANVVSKATGFANKWVSKVRENPTDAALELRDNVVDQVSFVRGKAEVGARKAREVADKYVPRARELADEYAPKVKDMASEYAPKVVEAVSSAVSSVKLGGSDSVTSA